MSEKKNWAEQTVKNLRRKTRKQYSAEEKIHIALEGLRGEVDLGEQVGHNRSMDAIELHGLQKVDHQNFSLDIEELVIPAGEAAALVGASNSGKEVLLELLTGKKRPTAGRVRVMGLDPYAEKNAFSRTAGVMFAEDSVYAQRTAEENLAFFCRLRKLPRSRVRETLSEIGLADQAGKKLDELPSGLRRRLVFGVATLHRPRALILSEPLARCDEATIKLLSNLIGEHKRRGAGVLILAGDDKYMNGFCERIYDLQHGRIVFRTADREGEGQAVPFKIPVRLDGKVALFNPAEILYADASDGKSVLQTHEGRFPTQFTLGELEEKLTRSGFFRAHRSYLINLQHVKEVIPYTRNSFSLRLNDEAGTLIPLSKAAAAELKALLGY